ncbi:glycosyltransferase family 2 protein [Micromonosporaceae bacterium Da 78-11]
MNSPVDARRTDLSAAVLLADVHLDAAVPAIPGAPGYATARLLIRLDGVPLGEIQVPLPADGLTPEQVEAAATAALGERIERHRADDSGPARRFTRPDRPADTPISVVIGTRDRTESLLRCLASLTRVHHSSFEVLVVDSAPTSARTAEALAGRSWPFPLRYLSTDRPGVAYAHNLALREASGEILAFTDDDVEVDPWWLAALADAFTVEGAACVTGLILPAELDTPAQLLLEEFGGYARGFDRRVFSLADPPSDPLFPFTVGRCGSGANMAFRADWLRGRGGFDPATGTGTPARGGDDLAAFADVLLDRRALVYEPAALVRHWHHREYGQLRTVAHSYGYGLGAYLTATIVRRPRAAAMMMRRAAKAYRYLTAPTSTKNQGKAADFPAELTRLERIGLLLGPGSYLKSRWHYRDSPLDALPAEPR